jgi:hypothetical protein
MLAPAQGSGELSVRKLNNAMPSAYIETTVPSYYVARPSLNLLQASRQTSTCLWWDSGCSGFDIFTSLEAIEEAQ